MSVGTLSPDINGAIFSPCRTWRYMLQRVWDIEKPKVMFVALNPSTADETLDDPTIRRCMAYARDWNYGGIYMLNLFAFRATDPRVMKSAPNPVGPDNNAFILDFAKRSKIVVAAWGNHGKFLDRSEWVRENVSPLYCLRVTGALEPNHPLYLPKALRPVLYSNRKGNPT